MRRMGKIGQSTAEYAIAFGVVIGGNLLVQNEVRDSIGTAIKDRAKEFVTNAGGVTTSAITSTRTGDSQQKATANMASMASGTVSSQQSATQIATTTVPQN